jgi:hypothetical protein
MLFHDQHGTLNHGEGFVDKFVMFLNDALKQPLARGFWEDGESHGVRLCVALGLFRGFSPMPQKDLMKGGPAHLHMIRALRTHVLNKICLLPQQFHRHYRACQAN